MGRSPWHYWQDIATGRSLPRTRACTGNLLRGGSKREHVLAPARSAEHDDDVLGDVDEDDEPQDEDSAIDEEPLSPGSRPESPSSCP
jgi:hypothetical protein